MLKEVLLIVPKLSNEALAKMERGLNSRFANVSKKFAKGIGSALMGGGKIGVLIGFLGKLVNPLESVNNAIDKLLGDAGKFKNLGETFGVSAGDIFKLVKMAEASGVSEDDVLANLSKFQTKIAEARADPKKDTSVRNFTGIDNVVDGFLEFITQMRKMGVGDQAIVQKDVFGQKQVLKMAQFFGKDFQELTNQLGLKNTAALTDQILGADKIGDYADIQKTIQSIKEFRQTAGQLTSRDSATGNIVGRDVISAQVEQSKRNQELLTSQIKSYQDIAASKEGIDAVNNTLEKIFLGIGSGAKVLKESLDINKKGQGIKSVRPEDMIDGGF
jgi:hypothetical protein